MARTTASVKRALDRVHQVWLERLNLASEQQARATATYTEASQLYERLCELQRIYSELLASSDEKPRPSPH